MKSFNFNGGGSPRALSEINVTSLVDVMTVLLIIFMITTPMIQSGVQVELPKAKAAAPDMDEGLVITITKDGSVYLEERLLTLSQFDAIFQAVYTKGDDRPVFIRGDEQVSYRDVITVLDKLKEHGVSKIGLATGLQSAKQ